MPAKPETLVWLGLARDDLAACQSLIRDKLYHYACFHAQQAAEKALKALILRDNRTVPRLHKLETLLKQTDRSAPSLRPLLSDCKILDQYYLPARYPDAFSIPARMHVLSREDARDALHRAGKVLRKIESIL